MLEEFTTESAVAPAVKKHRARFIEACHPDFFRIHAIEHVRRMRRRRDLEIRIALEELAKERDEFPLGLRVQAPVEVVKKNEVWTVWCVQRCEKTEDQKRPFTHLATGEAVRSLHIEKERCYLTRRNFGMSYSSNCGDNTS